MHWYHHGREGDDGRSSYGYGMQSEYQGRTGYSSYYGYGKSTDSLMLERLARDIGAADPAKYVEDMRKYVRHKNFHRKQESRKGQGTNGGSQEPLLPFKHTFR